MPMRRPSWGGALSIVACAAWHSASASGPGELVPSFRHRPPAPASNASAGAVEVDVAWQRVAFDVPGTLVHDYDPRCDTSSPHFEFHNKEALAKSGLKMHAATSQVGVLYIAWYVVKLVLAVLATPTMPIQRAAAWKCLRQKEGPLDAKDATDAKVAKVVHDVKDAKLSMATFQKLAAKYEKAPELSMAGNLPARYEMAPDRPTDVEPLIDAGDGASAAREADLEHFRTWASTRRAAVEPWGSEEQAWLAWHVETFEGEAAKKNLMLDRQNPEEELPEFISLSKLLCIGGGADAKTSYNYVRYKLSQPAKVTLPLFGCTLYYPWTTQVQMILFFAQITQGILEVAKAWVVGPPSYLTIMTSWDWVYLTFRAELFLPFTYFFLRLQLQLKQLAEVFTGTKGLDEKTALVTSMIASGFFVLFGLPYYPAVLLLGAFFVPAMPILFLIRRGGTSCPTTLQWLLRAWTLAGLACFCYVGHLWAHPDTYLCTFSRLRLLSSPVDFSSVSSAVLITAGVLLVFCVISAAVTMLRLAPSIVTPQLILWFWVRQSSASLREVGLEPEEQLQAVLDAWRSLEQRAME